MTKDTDILPYRPCVGIMLLNGENRVFVARRIDTTIEAWQMPQGGIDPGETPLEAAFREMTEEIGSCNAELLQEYGDWLCYDLPDHLMGKVWHGKYRGQKMKWYLMRFLGRDSDINLDTEQPEFNAWKWMDMAELTRSIVEFKRPLYEKLITRFGSYGE